MDGPFLNNSWRRGWSDMNVYGGVWAKPICSLKRTWARRVFDFFFCFFLFFAVALSAVKAQTSLKYQEPPKAMIDLVDARLTPYVEVSPGKGVSGRWLLIEEISGLPSIADLAQPELRLAGLRFNPKTNGPSRGRYGTGLRLKALPDGAERPIAGMPAEAKIRFAGWAPDARHVFFVNVSDAAADAGLSLWIVDVAQAQARRVPGLALNGIDGRQPEPDLQSAGEGKRRGAGAERSADGAGGAGESGAGNAGADV
jgi:hypothetical protein